MAKGGNDGGGFCCGGAIILAVPRVVFYLIRGGDAAREGFLLNFLEQKILARGWKTLIIAAPGKADELDERLWSARAGNFIPHARANAFNADDNTPVLIAESGESAPAAANVLILWGGDAPDNLSAFGHIVAAPPDDDALRQQKALFADRGCEINIHKIGAR